MKGMLFALALSFSAAASGQTPVLDQARAAGQVGERYDGYLGLGANASAALRNQVATINIRRRKIYSDFAASRRVSPQEVGITAGCQLLERVGIGEAYMHSDGAWRRRLAGQPAPVPDYCR